MYLIIQKIYEKNNKILKEGIKNVLNGEDVSSLTGAIKEFTDILGKELFSEIVSQIENLVFDDAKRKKQYESVRFAEKSLITKNGKTKFERRYYKDNETGENVCLTDRILGNRRNINIDMYLCETGNGKYILAIPEALKDDAEMFVETFNSGGKQRNNYGENVADAISDNGNGIETTIMDAITDFPVVMPIVPDIIGLPDFQQLSLESVRDFKIHERVLQCIEDAKTEIESITGKTVKEKIFLHGYSASGVFAQRFALIYPEIIGRCLIGGAAGSIPVPTKKIKYPIGIEDFEELFGKKFNMDDYKLIKFGYYVGEKEEQDTGEWGIDGEKCNDSDGRVRAPMHDMSFRGVTTLKEVGMVQRQYLGQTMNQRYKNSIEADKKIGIDIEGIILKDAGHKYIFDSRVTPTSQCLIRQLLNFYNNMQLNPKGEGCCSNLDESFQKEREAQSKEQDIIK